MSRFVSLVLLPVLLGVTQVAANDFDQKVAPLLVQRCLDCHSGPHPKGGLDLRQQATTRRGGKSGVALTPGKPDDSLLWQRVEAGEMPPKKPLAPAEKAILKEWIVAGAAWGTDPIDPFRLSGPARAGYDWWSLQPVVRPPIPLDPVTVRHPIDRFIQARLRKEGLTSSPEADRRTLIRRLSFDLLGLPPSPEEVDAFVRDPAPDAYERLVDRLLASPHHGVRWARHWLDIVRFGESNGFEHDEFRPFAWPYRDWVVRALNADLSYQEFARLQIAGDVLRPDDAEAIRATGFLVAGAYDSVGQSQQSAAMRKVVRQDELEDIVGTVGQTFLGLTVQCARCHDHKFDPVRQEEYYRLTAALGGVRHGERTLPQSSEDATQARSRIVELTDRLYTLEAPARKAALAGRKANPTPAPRPFASWDLAAGLHDQQGTLPLTLQGSAKLVAGGLKLDGKGYAATTLIGRDIKAKTLEAWVTLDSREQRGGGVVSLQNAEGVVFDAMVYGEREPGRWMAGSEGFVRTQSFEGPSEEEAHQRPVHIAIVWSTDGTVTAYRNGQVHGRSYTTALQPFAAGKATILLGLRHSPPGGNRYLSGVIHRAALHDRALTATEVARLGGDFVSEEELIRHLTPAQQAVRRGLQTALVEMQMRSQGTGLRTYAVVPRPREPATVLLRGDPQQPGPVVAPGGVAALAGVPASFDLSAEALEADGRRRLVAWLTHPRNPLFARVLVNRLWHYHFGVGLVDTPNDLGFNGGRPTHPELLDWLAAEFLDHQGSLKHLHRLLVTSATYRQQSRPTEEGLRRDASNRLLWRKSPMRLEAETVRDAMIAVTGKLNPRLEGPGFQEYRITRAVGTTTNRFTPVEPIGEEFDRRTLYRTWARGGRSGLLDAFDCPDPSTTTPSRAVTTTPLQALAMLNNLQVLRNAERLAERVRREAGSEVGAQVHHAYRLVYGRAPTTEEAATATKAVSRHHLDVLTRALLNSNEFLYID